MFLPRILRLKNIIENELGGKLEFIHMFEFSVSFHERIFYVHINTVEGEFFVLDADRKCINMFEEFDKLEKWFIKECRQ